MTGGGPRAGEWDSSDRGPRGMPMTAHRAKAGVPLVVGAYSPIMRAMMLRWISLLPP